MRGTPSDHKDYRSFWYTRYFPNSFCGICLTHQTAVTKAVIHPGYNLGYNSGEHRTPRYGSPPSLFRQRYCPCMGRTIQGAATRGLARRVGGMIQQVIQRCERVREVVDCQRENTTHRWARGFFPEGSDLKRLISR